MTDDRVGQQHMSLADHAIQQRMPHRGNDQVKAWVDGHQDVYSVRLLQ